MTSFPADLASRLAALPGVTDPARDTWRDLPRLVFRFHGRESYLVLPPEPKPGRPWLWRPTFFDAWPQADLELARRGFHLAYTEVLADYASPDGIAHGKAFRDLLVAAGLAPRFAFVALSRGGLYAFRYAEAFPGEVAAIHADAPVCDVRSWPGGRGRAPRAEAELRQLLASHRITEAEAFAEDFQPCAAARLEPLARAGIPLLHVCGMSDEVVPYEENTAVVERRYRRLGGEIALIPKPGIGHHPHGLDDPAPVVAFLERHAAAPPPAGGAG